MQYTYLKIQTDGLFSSITVILRYTIYWYVYNIKP